MVKRELMAAWWYLHIIYTADITIAEDTDFTRPFPFRMNVLKLFHSRADFVYNMQWEHYQRYYNLLFPMLITKKENMIFFQSPYEYLDTFIELHYYAYFSDTIYYWLLSYGYKTKLVFPCMASTDDYKTHSNRSSMGFMTQT